MCLYLGCFILSKLKSHYISFHFCQSIEAIITNRKKSSTAILCLKMDSTTIRNYQNIFEIISLWTDQFHTVMMVISMNLLQTFHIECKKLFFFKRFRKRKFSEIATNSGTFRLSFPRLYWKFKHFDSSMIFSFYRETVTGGNKFH